MLPRTSQIALFKPLSLSVFVTAVLGIASPINAQTVYGPVKSSDTLSKIVRRFYTGSESYGSVMRRIVVDNPTAFRNGDMNLLRLHASLTLSGDFWKQSAQSGVRKASRDQVVTNASADLVDRKAAELTVDQMKGRIVFLDAERSSLIKQVTELKQDTARLEKKIGALEFASQQSDEQLRILDAEIIRLTELLNSKSNESKVTKADLSQLVTLEEKLQLAQDETSYLRNELVKTQSQLVNNGRTSQQTNQTITQLTQENRKLQQLLQDTQPGVHYYNETASDYKLNILSGKFQLPVGFLVVGSAAMALILTTLLATRRKKKPSVRSPEADDSINPFAENHGYNVLLETESTEHRGFAQSHTQPEENVFKMFDEGTLEMDLKLGMAEAYLQVSDSDSARPILEEIVESGSELQKRKAARLIDRLAA